MPQPRSRCTAPTIRPSSTSSTASGRGPGINLRRAQFKTAYCIDGYYSKHEQRTGKHYDTQRVNKNGESIFRSFACTLAVGSRDFQLYVLTTRRGWRITADR